MTPITPTLSNDKQKKTRKLGGLGHLRAIAYLKLVVLSPDLLLLGGFSPYPSEKYELVKVSWDDDIPNWMEK